MAERVQPGSVSDMLRSVEVKYVKEIGLGAPLRTGISQGTKQPNCQVSFFTRSIKHMMDGDLGRHLLRWMWGQLSGSKNIFAISGHIACCCLYTSKHAPGDKYNEEL